MNSIYKNTLLVFTIFIHLNCSVDSDNYFPGQENSPYPPILNFKRNILSYKEGEAPLDIVIRFSKPAEKNGVIRLKARDWNDLVFSGVESHQSYLILHYQKGNREVSFQISKPNNNSFDKDQELTLELIQNSEFELGKFFTISIDIVDDEWIGLPKTMKKTTEDGISDWKQFFYGLNQQLSKEKQYTINDSVVSFYTRQFQYDQENNISRGKMEYFWQNGKVIYGEGYGYDYSFYPCIAKEWYQYNEHSQIIESLRIECADHYLTKYTYFDDGNVKTVEVYQKQIEAENYQYLSTSEYDYTTFPNPFPLFEIISTHSIQAKFPKTLTVYDKNDPDLKEIISYKYEYDDQGRVIAQWSGNKPSGYTRLEFAYY